MPEQPEHTAEVADPGAEAPVEAQGAPEVAGVSESSESSHPTESSETVEADVASESFEPVAVEPPVVYAADEVLLGSASLAQRALLEVTSPESVGSVIGHIAEGEHVLSLHFAADLAGDPGWHWSVTLARVDGGEPTVLETELMPGERALLAPEWVPWSERLAEYRAAQEAAAAAGAVSDDAGDDDEHDDDEHDDERGDDDRRAARDRRVRAADGPG